MPELTLFKEFDEILQDPDVIPKIRELILQLAFQGRLDEQNPMDEQVSVLLEKIKAEKERLIKAGKIKKSKSLPPIKPEEVPYELPGGWEWVRIRDIVHDLGQKKPEIEFSYIDVTSINKEAGIINTSEVQIISAKEAPSRARKIVNVGSVIYSTVRPYLLNIAIIEKKFNPAPIVSTAFAVLHPYTGITNLYIYYYLRSKTFINFVEKEMIGMAYPAISEGKFNTGLVPLPPEDEQKRIVTRVEELMAICDQLEEQQKALHENCQALNESVIHNVLEAKDQKEFQANWRLIQENFDYLYSNVENVEKLEQVILQLAVMGKLVEQGPNDEPASELLKNIKAEKEKLINEGKIKKSKPLSPIKPEEVPYVLPEGWEWIRLGYITNYGHCEKAEAKDIPDDAWLLDLEDIESYTSILLKKKLVIDAKPFSSKNIFRKNDVLYMKLRPYLNKVIVADDNGYCSSEMLPLHVYGGYCEPEFLKICLQAPSFVHLVNEKTYGMKMPRLGTNDGKMALIPFSPLEEQKRIVARVEELMALIKQMKEQIKSKNEFSQNLLRASIAEIVT